MAEQKNSEIRYLTAPSKPASWRIIPSIWVPIPEAMASTRPWRDTMVPCLWFPVVYRCFWWGWFLLQISWMGKHPYAGKSGQWWLDSISWWCRIWQRPYMDHPWSVQRQECGNCTFYTECRRSDRRYTNSFRGLFKSGNYSGTEVYVQISWIY